MQNEYDIREKYFILPVIRIGHSYGIIIPKKRFKVKIGEELSIYIKRS
jgi:hypothetical protein